MNFQYDTNILALAKNMHKMVQSGDVKTSTDKRVVALRAALNATATIYHKTFDEVYDEVSEYAAWFSIEESLENVTGGNSHEQTIMAFA